jgi:hypothetical protein
MATGGGVNGVIATGAISLFRIGVWTVEIVGDTAGAGTVIAIGDIVIGANFGAVSAEGDVGFIMGDEVTGPAANGCAFGKACGASTG